MMEPKKIYFQPQLLKIPSNEKNITDDLCIIINLPKSGLRINLESFFCAINLNISINRFLKIFNKIK